MTDKEKSQLAPLLNAVESILSLKGTNIPQNDYERLKTAFNDWETYRLMVEYKKAEREAFTAKNFELYNQIRQSREKLENSNSFSV